MTTRKAHARKGTRGVRQHALRVPVRPSAYSEWITPHGEWTPQELREYMRAARRMTELTGENNLHESNLPPEVFGKNPEAYLPTGFDDLPTPEESRERLHARHTTLNHDDAPTGATPL